MHRWKDEAAPPHPRLTMPARSLLRRFLVLAIALHLAALPIAAAIHVASHYQYEAGVALGHDAEPCTAAVPHRAHVERDRDVAGDLLCEVCLLFQSGLRHQSSTAAFHLEATPGPEIVLSFSQSSLRPETAYALPRCRAPPVLV